MEENQREDAEQTEIEGAVEAVQWVQGNVLQSFDDAFSPKQIVDLARGEWLEGWPLAMQKSVCFLALGYVNLCKGLYERRGSERPHTDAMSKTPRD
jgi:hypothetical protein